MEDIVGAIISQALNVTFVINQLLSASNQFVQNHTFVVVHTGIVAFHRGDILWVIQAFVKVQLDVVVSDWFKSKLSHQFVISCVQVFVSAIFLQ